MLIQTVGQDQAAEGRNFQPVAGALLLHIRPAKQQQRSGFTGRVFPVPLDGGNLRRLMLKGVQTMHIAHHGLDRGHHQRHPQRHREHLADSGRIVAFEKVPGTRGTHKQRAAQEGRDRHMQQAVGERRVKDDLEPVNRDHLAINNLMALRGMHPAVGSEDPEGRHQRAEGHHAGREKVQAGADLVPAEEHHAEETRLKEEGRQYLIGEQRPGNAPGKL